MKKDDYWGRTNALAAKRRYEEFTNNHPTIHTNRFPTWHELSEDVKARWYDPNYNGE